jgi:hypothetical protein
VEKAVSDELVAELLDAADDARRQIEAALEDMVLRFQLAMSIAVERALAPDDDLEQAV